MRHPERRKEGILRSARDPVCGMEVSVVHPNAQTEWEGVLYRFCSEECQRRFHRDPAAFVARPAPLGGDDGDGDDDAADDGGDAPAGARHA